jgi:ppGpp synthetase/RelA/SpoT-type nucleotidyltranferase
MLYAPSVCELPAGEISEDSYRTLENDLSAEFLMPRKYSNSAYNKAGDFARGGPESLRLIEDEAAWEKRWEEAFEIITDWRNLHGAPLRSISIALSRRAVKIDPDVLLAQRLKRYTSIRQKLRRSHENNLTTMQDVAGCRAVVETVARAYELKGIYDAISLNGPPHRPELVEKWSRDYIQSPKPDGYRSLHLVMRYQTPNAGLRACSGLKVEIQIRSRMQHAWAMAVETASAVTNQALKSGIGGSDWKRFFLLVGDLIADREGGSKICGMSIDDIRCEAASLAHSLRVINLLENMQHVIEIFTGFEGKDEMYLMELDSAKRQINYRGFAKTEFQEASAEYADLERQYKDNPEIHVVLVSVGSLEELREAYPSYFLNSSGFIELMREQIYGIPPSTLSSKQ